ncbi:MAG TPA: hypothetical protein VFE53_06390 [Mucilaginibacter sp.]|jgi:hypothetical protein|nr:hypothetical protein [Mucilaginibacter sp.]
MKLEDSVLNHLKVLINDYEDQCAGGRAESDDVRILADRIKKIMKKIGLDFCTINLIKLGSKKYKKYESQLDCSKWIMCE